MSSRSNLVKALIAISTILMFVTSTGLTLALANDYRMRDIVPAEVHLTDGTSLSGLDRDSARELMIDRLDGGEEDPFTVSLGDRHFTFHVDDAVGIDADAMLDVALSGRTSTPLAERMFSQITGESESVAVVPIYQIDENALTASLKAIASKVDTPPVDAAIFIDQGRIAKRSSAYGLKLEVEETARRITQALSAGVRRAELCVTETPPAIADEALGRTIVVSLSERRLRLYEGMDVKKTYRVAVGAPGHSTPRGTWEVINKRRMPTWRNPGSAWAADMPAVIPPGVNNPLGTRALDLNATAIRIHGTTKNYSIGTAASRGCIRMHRWDVEALFELVPVGTPVLIVR